MYEIQTAEHGSHFHGYAVDESGAAVFDTGCGAKHGDADTAAQAVLGTIWAAEDAGITTENAKTTTDSENPAAPFEDDVYALAASTAGQLCADCQEHCDGNIVRGN
jgi:hypothetical protein